MTIAELVEHLKTMPQDYEVWSNSGYYEYQDYSCDIEHLKIKVDDKEMRVYIAESL
jgi:hypothetical protein